MIVWLIGAALAHATVPSDGPELSVSIAAPDGQLRASQIAMVPAPRDAVIATMPEGAGEVAMSEAARLALVRNRYPGAAYRLRHDGAVRIVREASIESADGEAGCVASRTSIAAGAYLAADGLAPAPCRHSATGGWVGYDATARSFFARREIPAGTYLGRIPASAPPSVTEGAEVVYRTREGPVVVEREVVALQSGRAGRPVFVRTEEGQVLSARLSGAEDAE